MIDFGRPFSVDFGGYPSHMSAIDSVLWSRLRGAGNLPFTKLYFDVAVGRGVVAPAGTDPKVVVAWSRLTRLRIDVVGEAIDHWVIIEVRGNAGPGAVGSLLCYDTLWAQEPPDQRPVELWLVTDAMADNLREVLERFSIRLFIV